LGVGLRGKGWKKKPKKNARPTKWDVTKLPKKKRVGRGNCRTVEREPRHEQFLTRSAPRTHGENDSINNTNEGSRQCCPDFSKDAGRKKFRREPRYSQSKIFNGYQLRHEETRQEDGNVTQISEGNRHSQ